VFAFKKKWDYLKRKKKIILRRVVLFYKPYHK